MLLTRKYCKCWFICFRSDFCVGWLISNCHWSPAKRIVSFHVPKAVNSFCHTSAAKMVSSLEMFTGPQRNDDLWFTSQMECVTFAIRLQRKRYLAWKCSLVCRETMTFISATWRWRVFVIRLQRNWRKISYLLMLWCEFGCGHGIQYNLQRFLNIWKPKIPKRCLWDS